MAFVNEFISKEDEKKFIDRIQLERKLRTVVDFHLCWTRDAEREIWLTKLHGWRPEMGGGFHAEWLLYDHGRYFEFFLDDVRDDPPRDPRSITWTFFGFNPRFAPIPPKEEQTKVLQLLKELLTAYGYWGAHRQEPNAIITFTNF